MFIWVHGFSPMLENFFLNFGLVAILKKNLTHVVMTVTHAMITQFWVFSMDILCTAMWYMFRELQSLSLIQAGEVLACWIQFSNSGSLLLSLESEAFCHGCCDLLSSEVDSSMCISSSSWPDSAHMIMIVLMMAKERAFDSGSLPHLGTTLHSFDGFELFFFLKLLSNFFNKALSFSDRHEGDILIMLLLSSVSVLRQT